MGGCWFSGSWRQSFDNGFGGSPKAHQVSGDAVQVVEISGFV